MSAPIGNKNAAGNSGGRPPVYGNAEELAAKVDEYFVWIEGEYHEEKQEVTDKNGSKKTADVKVYDRQPEPATVTGLALFLGFNSRQTLYEYEQKIEFSDIIKRARTRVESEYEKRLHYREPTGAIFALKNMGWRDKQELEHTGKDGGPIETAKTKTVIYIPDNGRSSS